MLLSLSTIGLAKITALPNGNFEITSENVYEIAEIKAQRDYYRDELEKELSKNSLSLNVGLGTSKGVYAEVEYKLW